MKREARGTRFLIQAKPCYMKNEAMFGQRPNAVLGWACKGCTREEARGASVGSLIAVSTKLILNPERDCRPEPARRR
jgi:hypothetical protein